MDDLDVAGDNAPSTSTSPSNGHTGITLVLPSLRVLKAANAGKKSKAKHALDEQRPKIPRPIKLKPLKEVLTKLIAQIKRKDDYAFFIHPVNLAQVPGYTDVIKNPMDFGTIANKVAKGKYRSLEEFSADFRLVTTNAKTFNPPGSIYYIEADRLEAWGLEHITRSSAHVIEYETDWNIDVEQDDETSQQHVNIDDEASTPRDLESMAAGSRAPSMTPAPGQASTVGQGKRGPRGPYKKHAQTGLSEGLDAEGRMPGAKDGVGAFPAGSDWAELMIALKIKGKRYKTKKERLRFEKEGPPYHADGSLDYGEMEDPFSVLNVLVPEPPTPPQVTPLYPPASVTMHAPAPVTIDGHQPRSRMYQSRIYAPTPVTIPFDRSSPALSTRSDVAAQLTVATSTSTSTSAPPALPPKKRRHWTIIRNVPARSRGKDKEGDPTPEDAKTSWKVPRDAGLADYGTFATFLGDLVASAVGPHASTSVGGAAEYIYGSEPRLFATIRSTVEHRGVKRKREAEEGQSCKNEEEGEGAETFWTDDRAEEAWDYLRDVVYGGVDGYAYVRSLAEFVAPSVYLGDVREPEGDGDGGGGGGGGGSVVESTPPENGNAALPLGVSVARFVEDNLVDMVTRGRHGWLRDVLLPCASATAALDPCCPVFRSPKSDTDPSSSSTSPFYARLAVLPDTARTMTLKASSEERLDMAALIRAPEELTIEGVLEGGEGGGESAEIERALVWSAGVIEELGRQVAKEGEREREGVCEDVDEKVEVSVKQEAAEDARVVEEEEEEEANPNAMDVDATSEDQPKVESDTKAEEDPLVKRLRMNLLALAKRLPLDRIAKLPVELVPEDIRGIVPTA